MDRDTLLAGIAAILGVVAVGIATALTLPIVLFVLGLHRGVYAV